MRLRRLAGLLLLLTLLMLLCVGLSDMASGQEDLCSSGQRVDAIMNEAYNDRPVKIIGNFGHWKEYPDTPPGIHIYVISDRFEGSIEVHTMSSRRPPPGVSGLVEGTYISYPVPVKRPDGKNVRGFIREKRAARINPATCEEIDWDATPLTPAALTIPQEISQLSKKPVLEHPLVLGLVIATGLMLLCLFGTLIAMLRGGTRPPETDFLDGNTLRIPFGGEAAFQQGTVKVLPGRFEVVEGEDRITEVRLFSTASNAGREFAIVGSVTDMANLPPNCIGFKSNTVSANQGRLLCSPEGQYRIINYANPETKNPVIVNGMSLSQGESRLLNDKDMIQIGIVKMKYHAS
jgi:hypothetical protein